MKRYPSSKEVFDHVGHKPTMAERLLAGIYDLLREQNGMGDDMVTPLLDVMPVPVETPSDVPMQVVPPSPVVFTEPVAPKIEKPKATKKK